jgi:hypothetical protein
MTSLLNYSELDAEQDAMLYMKECFDINSYSFIDHRDLNVSHHSSSSKGQQQRCEVVETVAKHLKNLRFLDFAEEALARELEVAMSLMSPTATHSSIESGIETTSSPPTSSSSSSSEKESRRESDKSVGNDNERLTEESKQCRDTDDKGQDEDHWEMVDHIRSSGQSSMKVNTEPERSPTFKLPLSVPLKDVVSTMSAASSTSNSTSNTSKPTGSTATKQPKIAVRLETEQSRELQLKQLKKDVERDRLLINSKRLVGASVGLEEVIQSIIFVFHTLADECYLTRLSDDVVREVAIAILLKASRTHSGALAFQALQNLIDPEQFMLIPQSSSTPPLNICIRLGSEHPPHHGSNMSSIRELGYICRIACESRYKVQRRLDPMMMMMVDDDLEGLGSQRKTNQQEEQETQQKSQQSEDVQDPGTMMTDKVVSALFEDFIFVPLPSSSFQFDDKVSSHSDDMLVYEEGQRSDINNRKTSAEIPDANQLLHNCDRGQVLISLFE